MIRDIIRRRNEKIDKRKSAPQACRTRQARVASRLATWMSQKAEVPACVGVSGLHVFVSAISADSVTSVLAVAVLLLELGVELVCLDRRRVPDVRRAYAEVREQATWRRSMRRRTFLLGLAIGRLTKRA
jgi:hypothetical protein